jgi:micrococcal nuclease
VRPSRPRTFGGLFIGLVVASALIWLVSGVKSPGIVLPGFSDEPPAPPAPAAPLLKPSDKTPSLVPPGAERVAVKRAVDGDTVELEDGRKVRYLGIDTPEKGENFYVEARDANAAYVAGKEAWLEFDVEKSDKYGRLLAFVWVQSPQGALLVNAELIRSGLAYAYTPGPNAKHKESLVACQREARENGRGFWKDYVLGRDSSFVTTRNGHAFHKEGCEALKSANPDNLRSWKSRDDVMDAGFSPCRTCKP